MSCSCYALLLLNCLNSLVSEEVGIHLLMYHADLCGIKGSKIITKSPMKSCSLEPIPTRLLPECLDWMIPVITHIINYSLLIGVLLSLFKCIVIIPLLKKPSLNPINFKIYPPISNPPFLSSIPQKAVLHQHLDHYSCQTSYLNHFSQPVIT